MLSKSKITKINELPLYYTKGRLGKITKGVKSGVNWSKVESRLRKFVTYEILKVAKILQPGKFL